MKLKLSIGIVVVCVSAFACAQSEENEKSAGEQSELQRATETVEHMSATAPDKGVPKQVLEGAKCVAVIPKLVKGAFVVGGEHGTGVATCRTNDRSWSAPAPFSVSGISWGPQIGGKSTDLLMFIMNEQGMNDLLSGHFQGGCRRIGCGGPGGTAGFRGRRLEGGHPDLFQQQGRVHRCVAEWSRIAAGSEGNTGVVQERSLIQGNSSGRHADSQLAGKGVRECGRKRERNSQRAIADRSLFETKPHVTSVGFFLGIAMSAKISGIFG